MSDPQVSDSGRWERTGAVAAEPPLMRAAAPRRVASSLFTRLLSLGALAALGAGVLLVAQAAYFAFTDAWIAPLQLSPDSREVIAVRTQDAREKGERARLESEIAGVRAEVAAIDVSVERLRALGSGYANALRWSSANRGDRLTALRNEKALLEEQRELLGKTLVRENDSVERAERNFAAGIITGPELGEARRGLDQAALSLSEKELEYARVSAALDEVLREASALVRATAAPLEAMRGVEHASPDVVRFEELAVNIELQLARLLAERRGAEARQRAAEATLESMTQLRRELESTPFFLAAQKEMDLAFVSYPHLDRVGVGDAVYSCQWWLLDCRATGTIKRIFSGEIATDDPWGTAARGRYVELDLSDRSAVNERTLRVRSRRGVDASRSPLVLAP